MNIRGAGPRRFERAALFVVADLALQLLIVVLGLALLFDPEVLTDPAVARRHADVEDMLFAFTLAIVAFTGLDASSGFAGQVAISRRGLKRLFAARTVAAVAYIGIALVASATLPQTGRAAGRGADARRRRRVRRRTGCASRCATLVAVSAVARARDRVHRRDARPVAARLLAGRQPPDPVAHRPAAPALQHAVRGDRHRRGAGDRARAVPRTSSSSPRSTRSARRSPSRSCTCRCSRCASASRTATARSGCRSTSGSAAARCRCRRWSARSMSAGAFVACSPSTTGRASSARSGWRSASRCT